MATNVTVSSKGQITLPAKIRDTLGIERGDRLSVVVDDETHSIRLRRVDRLASLEELSAHLTSQIPPGVEPVADVDAYYQAHRDLPE